MFMVYWTEVQNDKKTPKQQDFGTDEMSSALTYMEALRSKQRHGEAISFITMQSENPNSVGHPGVASAGVDYNWKKRRS